MADFDAVSKNDVIEAIYNSAWTEHDRSDVREEYALESQEFRNRDILSRRASPFPDKQMVKTSLL